LFLSAVKKRQARRMDKHRHNNNDMLDCCCFNTLDVMRILKCKYLGKKTRAISLAPFAILVKPEYAADKVLLNHEKIHWQQQKELWYIGFYIQYFVEWIFKGYGGISFEVEAYANERNLDYLKTRK
jgi:hypothetical protein